jgi:hypothetical protein
VIAFPAAKRIGKIRRAASVLASKHGAAAETYWKQTITTLGNQLRRAGLDEAVVHAQVRAFHDAVQAELRRPLDTRGGGDAA